MPPVPNIQKTFGRPEEPRIAGGYLRGAFCIPTKVRRLCRIKKETKSGKEWCGSKRYRQLGVRNGGSHWWGGHIGRADYLCGVGGGSTKKPRKITVHTKEKKKSGKKGTDTPA